MAARQRKTIFPKLTPELLSIAALCAAAFGAGSIRGFSGFGDALFFLPIAGFFLPPLGVILVFTIIASLGPIPLIPQAIREAPRKLTRSMAAAMIIGIPVGFLILLKIDPQIFRYLLSFMAIGVVVIMAFGLAPHFEITARSIFILGLICGVIGGFTGVPGAFMVIVFLHSNLRPKDIRAISLIMLLIFDLFMLVLAILSGYFEPRFLIIALAALPFYALGGMIGRRLFDPDNEKRFRFIAMMAILFSGIIGLPIFANIHA